MPPMLAFLQKYAHTLQLNRLALTYLPSPSAQDSRLFASAMRGLPCMGAAVRCNIKDTIVPYLDDTSSQLHPWHAGRLGDSSRDDDHALQHN